MATDKQISAARKNVRKAAAAAKEKRTIAHLPKSTRTALGKQGAKVAAQKRKKGLAPEDSPVARRDRVRGGPVAQR